MKYLLLLILGLFLIAYIYVAIVPQDSSIVSSLDSGNLRHYIDMEAGVVYWYLYDGGIEYVLINETNPKTLY